MQTRLLADHSVSGSGMPVDSSYFNSGSAGFFQPDDESSNPQIRSLKSQLIQHSRNLFFRENEIDLINAEAIRLHFIRDKNNHFRATENIETILSIIRHHSTFADHLAQNSDHIPSSILMMYQDDFIDTRAILADHDITVDIDQLKDLAAGMRNHLIFIRDHHVYDPQQMSAREKAIVSYLIFKARLEYDRDILTNAEIAEREGILEEFKEFFSDLHDQSLPALRFYSPYILSEVERQIAIKLAADTANGMEAIRAVEKHRKAIAQLRTDIETETKSLAALLEAEKQNRAFAEAQRTAYMDLSFSSI
jgi:hypothetical protein